MNNIELAISTDFMGEQPELEQLQSILRKIADAGFTHIHWCHEWEGDYIYSSFEMQQIREWMDECGLQGKALHASKGSRKNVNIRREHYRRDYTSDWEYNRKAGVELIKNRIDMAVCLGVHEIVLHLYPPHFTILEKPETKENFYDCVYKSFDELMPYCLKKMSESVWKIYLTCPVNTCWKYGTVCLKNILRNFSVSALTQDTPTSSGEKRRPIS